MVHHSLFRRPSDTAKRDEVPVLVGTTTPFRSLPTAEMDRICTLGRRKYIMQATSRWMDPNGDGDPSDGVDGWRLDVANEVPNRFWQDWNRYVRQINPQAYTVAEFWSDAGDYLRDCGFSAMMNYHGFAMPAKAFLFDQRVGATDFGIMIDQRMQEHPQDVRYALQNLLDSHDTPPRRVDGGQRRAR